MADIVNVGIAGRVYVRFAADSPADQSALATFKRAGARLDRERGLWFVGAHHRDSAVRACLETGGDYSGDLEADAYRVAPDGGVQLGSGWVLTAATETHIWFVNPFLADSPDGGAVVIPIDQARHLSVNSPRRDVRRAFGELIAAAARIPRTPAPRKPFTAPDASPEAPKPSPTGSDPRPGWKATEKQTKALDVMLSKLARLDDDAAERFRDELDTLGGFDGITKTAASRLIDAVGGAIEEAQT